MKNLLILFVSSIILWSCNSTNKNENSSAYFDFELEIDTVQVNSGNEILMAGATVRNPGVSSNKKWFYSWDQKNFALEIVDLENYNLENKVYFEQDGPNGIGPNYFYRVDPFPNNQFGFEDYESYRIYDLDGNMIKKVNFSEEWINTDLTKSESFELSSVNRDGTVLAGMHFGFDGYKPLMFLLDLEAEKAQNITLTEFEKLKKYKIVLRRNGGYLTSSYPRMLFKFQGDSLLISNTAFNDIYIYNDQTKELKYKTFDHKLIPAGKQKSYKTETESEEEIRQIIYDISEEVTFTEFFWDEQDNRFYRFANQAIYRDKNENPKWNVSIMVYDHELKLIGEKELMTFDYFPEPLFVKDGKVHFHLNMEDELGFIRIGLKS
jgi:hypothetical protein